MSQGFNFKYDELRANNPTGTNLNNGDENYQVYQTERHVRNVCFVLLDGRMIFLNYAYLVSGEFSPEENKITLEFTTHSVTLEGVYLDVLFEKLLDHIPRKIVSSELRYNSIKEKGASDVNRIYIIKNT